VLALGYQTLMDWAGQQGEPEPTATSLERGDISFHEQKIKSTSKSQSI
jgi:hypothetical protein